MTKKKYQHYSPEFKGHALRRASEDGVTDRGEIHRCTNQAVDGTEEQVQAAITTAS